MKLHIPAFGGIAPALDPRDLPETGAQEAKNIRALGGTLKPLRALSDPVATLSGTAKTLHRFGDSIDGMTPTWFGWESPDVDVVRSQIAGDQFEWTFFTGETHRGGYLRATYGAAPGSPIPGYHTLDDPIDPIELPPTGSLQMRMPAPEVALTATSEEFAGSKRAKFTIWEAPAMCAGWSDYTAWGGVFPRRIVFVVQVGEVKTPIDPGYDGTMAGKSFHMVDLAGAINAVDGVQAFPYVQMTVGNPGIIVRSEATGSDAYVKLTWAVLTDQTVGVYPEFTSLTQRIDEQGFLEARGTELEVGLPETRVYTYTRVYRAATGYEIESQPAPIKESSIVTVYPYSTEELEADPTLPAMRPVEVSGQIAYDGEERPDVFVASQGGIGTFFYRLYRAVAGQYLLVDELNNDLTYADTKSADQLSLTGLPSLTWTSAPEGLRGIVNLPNGVIAGFRGRDVYFCEPYRPHAWPVHYSQTVDFPVVGLATMDTTLVVLTEGTPFFMQGSHPDSMTVVQGQLKQGCVSKRSIVSMNGVVYYASPDGLVSISPNGMSVVTAGIIEPTQWREDFKPETIHAYAHELEYVAFSDRSDDLPYNSGFVYSPATQVFIHHHLPQSDSSAAGFTDLKSGRLYVAFTLFDGTTEIRRWDDVPRSQDDAWGVVWWSKVFVLPFATGFSWGQVRAEAYPLNIELHIDGVHSYQLAVQNARPFRLPSRVGHEVEIVLWGFSKGVYDVTLAQSAEELASD